MFPWCTHARPPFNGGVLLNLPRIHNPRITLDAVRPSVVNWAEVSRRGQRCDCGKIERDVPGGGFVLETTLDNGENIKLARDKWIRVSWVTSRRCWKLIKFDAFSAKNMIGNEGFFLKVLQCFHCVYRKRMFPRNGVFITSINTFNYTLE